MVERLEAMQTELGSLFDALRTGGNRLNADLQLLETNLEEVGDAVRPRPRFRARRAGSAPPSRRSARDAPADDHPSRNRERQGPGRRAGRGPGGRPTTGRRDDDPEGARLIALNMALNGTPREETERYLSEHFRLPTAADSSMTFTPLSKVSRRRT